MSQDFRFEVPQRQAPAAVVFILLTFLRRSVRQFWPLLLILVFQQGEKRGMWALLIFLGITVFQLIFSLITYFRFFFYVEGEDVVLEHRRLNLQRTTIPLDRVQTIEFEQSVLHRMMNVVKLKIDTAGSGKAEMNLDALSVPKAEALRDFILDQKALMIAERGEGIETEGENDRSEAASSERLFSLDLPTLIRIGLAQNHIRMAGLIIGFFLGLYQYVDEYLPFRIGEEEVVDFALGFESQIGTILMGIGIVAPLLFLGAIIVSLVRTVARYFDFSAWKTERGLKLQAGLLTRREQSASRNKLQLVRWYQTWLERKLDLRRVRLFQASSQAAKKKESLTLPGARAEHLTQIQALLSPATPADSQDVIRLSAKIVGYRIFWRGVLPALLLSVGLWAPSDGWSLVFLGLIPYSIWAARSYFANWQARISSANIQLEAGIWGRKGSLLPWYKVQTVRFQQSPFERRHGLKTVQLISAGGKVQLPFLPVETANAISNFALYQVESSQVAWM